MGRSDTSEGHWLNALSPVLMCRIEQLLDTINRLACRYKPQGCNPGGLVTSSLRSLLQTPYSAATLSTDTAAGKASGRENEIVVPSIVLFAQIVLP